VSANYEISYGAGTLTVAKAALVVTASAGSMTYGGAGAVVTPGFAGFVNDEDVSDLSGDLVCVGGSPTTAAGVHPNATSCAGAASANYEISYVKGTLTVAKAALVVTASAGSMTYGGAGAVVTPGFAGFVNDEDVSDLTGELVCVGGSPTTAAGVHPNATSCAGAASANYEISYGAGTLTVAKAALVVTASPGSMTYGGAGAIVTPGFAGFANDEDVSDLTGDLICVGGASTTPAGVHPNATSCSGAASANYEISYVAGTLTVDKAMLIVRADAKAKVFGQPVPALSYSVTGFVNGEHATVLSGAPLLATSATPTSPVGVYPITITQGTLGADNYRFTLVDSVLNVTPASTGLVAAPAAITLLPLKVNLGKVSARLTYPAGGAPVAGQTVVFTTGSRTLCSATTGTDGTASCSLTLAQATAVILNLGYNSTFAGSSDLLPSSASAHLFR
jgi:hypothetical protein